MFWKKKKKKSIRQDVNNNFKTVAITSVGQVREHNEDSIWSLSHGSASLSIVADGLGGHASGEVASQMAIDGVVEGFDIKKNYNADWIKERMTLTNQLIFQKSTTQNKLNGMGTTLAILYINGQKYYWGNVGDSRIYLYEEGQLKQITTDHTLHQALLSQGQKPNGKEHHFLTRAIGTRSAVKIDVGEGDLPKEKRSRFLLCSDGLYDLVSEEIMHKLLCTNDHKEAASTLVAKANQNGGRDNISVIIVDIEPTPQVTDKSTKKIIL